jgi:Rrf2 family protein
VTHHSRFAVSVHILSYLAFRAGALVPSGEIAASVATHPVVIRRVLSALVQARLVRARKGATGGFVLARPAREISLLTIYQAVEPAPNHGMSHFAPNHRCPVGAKIEEVLHGIFSRAQAGMETELGRVTLAEVEGRLHAVCPGRKKPAGEPAP